MIKGRIRLFAVTLFATAILTGPAAFADDPVFSDAQKQEMHKIIREYLITNPDVLREAFEALERQQQLAQQEQARQRIQSNADALFRSEHGYTTGNPEGSVTVVEFFDYNCGYCKRSLPDVVNLVKQDGDLKVVLKEFPILGPGSVYAARAALASRKQNKYWDFHVAMMSNRGSIDEAQVLKIAGEVGLDIEKLKADMEGPEVAAAINESMELAGAVGINGTPAFVIGDNLIPGALGLSGLQAHIASVRDNGGCKVC